MHVKLQGCLIPILINTRASRSSRKLNWQAFARLSTRANDTQCVRLAVATAKPLKSCTCSDYSACARQTGRPYALLTGLNVKQQPIRFDISNMTGSDTAHENRQPTSPTTDDQPAATSAADRRKYGRIRCEQLYTKFGEVLDLSASGMRALCKRWRSPRLGQELVIELRHPQGVAHLPAKIVWVKKQGLRRYEVGFTFEDHDEQTRKELMKVTRMALQSIAISHRRHNLE